MARGGVEVRDQLKLELKKRGLAKRIRANNAGCLDSCEYGVTVVGVKAPGKDFTYAEAGTVVSNHDLIIVSGNSVDIEKFATLQS